MGEPLGVICARLCSVHCAVCRVFRSQVVANVHLDSLLGSFNTHKALMFRRFRQLEGFGGRLLERSAHVEVRFCKAVLGAFWVLFNVWGNGAR